MIKLRIGGVPEHFNMPWQLLLRSGELPNLGIDATWQDFQGGTGAMGQALDIDDLDIGILLTEGAIQGIDKGKKYKIISFYVDSPLTWGIHVFNKSNYQNIGDLRGKNYAISRYGSGSHLMAMIDGKERGWDYQNLNFVEVESLQGARLSLERDESQLFFWEKFTTKPLVDSGEFRRIAERKTPFSCFVICVSDKALQEKSSSIAILLNQLYNQVKLLLAQPNLAAMISEFYELEILDVQNWLIDLKWSNQPHLNPEQLGKAISVLKELQLIGNLSLKELCHYGFVKA